MGRKLTSIDPPQRLPDPPVLITNMYDRSGGSHRYEYPYRWHTPPIPALI